MQRLLPPTTDEEIKNAGAAGFIKYDERRVGELVISYYRRFAKVVV